MKSGLISNVWASKAGQALKSGSDFKCIGVQIWSEAAGAIFAVVKVLRELPTAKKKASEKKGRD